MPIQDIINKVEKGEKISSEELKVVQEAIDNDLNKLKEEDPEKFLEYLKKLDEVLGTLNEMAKTVREGSKN